MHHLLRRLSFLLLCLLVLLPGMPAWAAVLAQPSDNNLHIDRGVSYNAVVFLSTTGGTAPYSFSFAGALPSGITVSSDGLLTGVTCGSNGTYALGAVTVTDAVGATASKTGLTLIVNAAPAGGCSLTVSGTLSTGSVGTAYSGSLSATGGTSPYTYSVSSGSLPAGVTLSSTGTLSGTPTTAGTYTFSVLVSDAGGATGTQTFTLTINSGVTVTVSPSSLSAGVSGVAYSQTLSGSGGTGPYSFAVTTGSLPAGLSLASGGGLSGTPSAAGSSSFTVTATDANGATGTRSYTLTIGAALSTTQAVASSTLTAGVAATAFTPVTAAGGTTPYTFAVSPALPTGLSFNTSTGQVTGTPSAASASASYTVTVTDANGTTSSKTFTLVVNAAASVSITPSSLSAGVVGVAYSRTFGGSGGTAPYAFTVTAGTLPTGLALSSGQLVGTPSAAGSNNFTITANDANGATGARSYTLTIGAALSTTQAVASSTLTAGMAATAFTPVTAAGGTTPYTFAVSPALPTGLSFNTSTGQVTGTPSAASASASYTVTVTDANGTASSKTFTLVVGTSLTTTQAVPTQQADAGQALANFTPVTATGGTGPYTFAIAPALPAGLSFDAASGTISGTPLTALAPTTFTVTVTDATGAVSTQTFSLEVRAFLTAVTQVDNTVAQLDSPVGPFTPVVVSGGTQPYAFSVGPALPAGLTMNAGTGEVSGTPTQTTPMADYTVTIVDANGNRATRAFRLATTAVVALDVQPRQVSIGQAGVPVNLTLVASGGAAPYSFALASGTWPEGLTMDANGRITGRARRAGIASVTVRVTDANGNSVDAVLAVSIGARPDPTADATVNGLQLAQAEALKRFGSAQLRNMLDRLDDDRECLPEMDARTQLGADWRKASTESPKAPADAPGASRDKECSQGLAGWMAGTVQHGRINGATAAGNTRFSTPGLTLGWDGAVAPGVRVGLAIGHGSDRSEVGGGAGRLDASADSLAAYATWRLPAGLRLSAAFGQGSATMTTSRGITGDTLVVDGQRHVKQTFAALAGSARFEFGAWRLSPQLVLERQDARLGAYAESGDSPLALAYDEARLRSNEVRGGVKLSVDWPMGAWSLEPALQIEWRRRSAGELSQTLHYADDVAGASYTLTTRDPAVEQGQIGIGLRARTLGGWSAAMELRGSVGGSATRSSSLAASLQRSF